jgi:hypothetical protein
VARRQAGGINPPYRRGLAQRGEHDVAVAAPDRQVGQQGDARAARDERLAGGDLIDLEGDLGLEPRAADRPPE